MAGGRRRDDFISIIPDDLKVFESRDIARVFDYLEKTFRVSKSWRVEFRKELNTVVRSMSEQEFFFQYTIQHIDPALQRILRRNDSVIFAVSRYLIKDRMTATKLKNAGR